ncbi:MAG: hypothetical protein IJP50_02560 [Paludibacteraceae bacterium]|nr:hypothetical protein [Paludibacteraceae bacterium]
METNMVKTLKSNEEYMEYIKKRISKVLPDWILDRYVNVPNINGYFKVAFKSNAISIVFSKEFCELLIDVSKRGQQIKYSIYKSLYNNIDNYIPVKSKSLPTSISVNLIDYYIDYLKENIDKFEFEE